MIGVSPPFANVFRRLILSDVPSMAIDKVLIYNNTSIIQDEVLAHRLGLIPLKADPRLFEFKANENDPGTDQDTLEFDLNTKCTRKGKDILDSASFDTLYKNHKIYSSQIKWNPVGKQADVHKETDIGPVHDDILISKMRPGHEFNIKLIAVKGIGRDHAKFSPVEASFYRILPDITINRKVTGEDALLLQKCFSPGVIELNEKGEAYVKDARYDSCSRNVFRYPHLTDAVTMSRVRDHFIFSIESVGALPPDVIFTESVKILKRKCRKLLDEVQGL